MTSTDPLPQKNLPESKLSKEDLAELLREALQGDEGYFEKVGIPEGPLPGIEQEAATQEPKAASELERARIEISERYTKERQDAVEAWNEISAHYTDQLNKKKLAAQFPALNPREHYESQGKPIDARSLAADALGIPMGVAEGFTQTGLNFAGLPYAAAEAFWGTVGSKAVFDVLAEFHHPTATKLRRYAGEQQETMAQAQSQLPSADDLFDAAAGFLNGKTPEEQKAARENWKRALSPTGELVYEGAHAAGSLMDMFVGMGGQAIHGISQRIVKSMDLVNKRPRLANYIANVGGFGVFSGMQEAGRTGAGLEDKEVLTAAVEGSLFAPVFFLAGKVGHATMEKLAKFGRVVAASGRGLTEATVLATLPEAAKLLTNATGLTNYDLKTTIGILAPGWELAVVIPREVDLAKRIPSPDLRKKVLKDLLQRQQWAEEAFKRGLAHWAGNMVAIGGIAGANPSAIAHARRTAATKQLKREMVKAEALAKGIPKDLHETIVEMGTEGGYELHKGKVLEGEVHATLKKKGWRPIEILPTKEGEPARIRVEGKEYVGNDAHKELQKQRDLAMIANVRSRQLMRIPGTEETGLPGVYRYEGEHAQGFLTLGKDGKTVLFRSDGGKKWETFDTSKALKGKEIPEPTVEDHEVVAFSEWMGAMLEGAKKPETIQKVHAIRDWLATAGKNDRHIIDEAMAALHAPEVFEAAKRNPDRVVDRMMELIETGNADQTINQLMKEREDAETQQGKLGDSRKGKEGDEGSLRLDQDKQDQAESPKAVRKGEEVVGTPSSQRRDLPLETTTTERVSPMSIIKRMVEMGKAPIRHGRGHHKQRKALGWYSVRQHLIRNAKENDLQTAFHEFGHASQKQFVGWDVEWPAEVQQELLRLGKELYGDRDPKGGYDREGWAEFVARSIMDRDAATFAPKTEAWMREHFKEFAQHIDELAKLYRVHEAQGAAGRMDEMIVKHADANARKWRDLRQTLRTNFDTAAAPLQDALDVLKKESKGELDDLSVAQDPAKLYQALRMTAPQVARSMVFDGMMDVNYDRTGPSLKSVLEPVRKEFDDFVRYVVAQRVETLASRKKSAKPDVGFELKDAKFVIETVEADPQRAQRFKTALEQVTAWNRGLLRYVASSGGLGAAELKLLEELDLYYVPFKRHFDNNLQSQAVNKKGVVDQSSPVKRMKGSRKPIMHPIETMILEAERMVTWAHKAQIARSVVELAARTENAGWWANEVPPETVATKFSLKDIERQLVKIDGVYVGDIDLDRVLTVFHSVYRADAKENVFPVWIDGKKRVFELFPNNPEVVRVLTDMEREYIPAWMRTMYGGPARVVRAGATALAPGFGGVTNPIRDAFAAFVFTQGKASLLDTPRGLVKVLKNDWLDMPDEHVDMFRRMGGSMATFSGQERHAYVGRELEKMLAVTRKEKGRYWIKDPIKNAYDGIVKMIGWSEEAPRVREFQKVLAKAEAKYGKGTRSARLEALLAAKDITVDFTRAGLIGQGINIITPFYNARIQGLHKLVRELSGPDRMKVGARIFGLFTVPSFLFWFANKDEQWWKDLKPYQKLTHWNPVEGARLPVGEVGQQFGTFPMLMLDAMYEKDPDLASKSVLSNLWDLIPYPPDVLAVYEPWFEGKANYDLYRDQPIVSPYDKSQGLDKTLPHTSTLAKAVAEVYSTLGLKHVTGIEDSPAILEHVLSGYTGGMFKRVGRSLDMTLGLNKNSGKPHAHEIPILGRLFWPPTLQSWSVDKFYEHMDALEGRIAGAKKHGRAVSSRDVAVLKGMKKLSESMSQLREGFYSGTMDFKKAKDLIREMADKGLELELVGK